MSDTTLFPEDHLKQINLKGNEGKIYAASTDSLKIYITDAESDEKKNINERTDNEDLAERANKQDKDETINLETSKVNDDIEKASKDEGGKEYMVYGYYGRGQNEASLPTTWVQFQGGFDRRANYDSNGSPLDYDPSSRNSFVMRVFGIVFVMLLCTVGFVAFVLSSPDVKNMFQKSGLLFAIPAMIIIVGLSYAMSCSSCTRVFPCNVICLMLAVLCMSVTTAYITSRFNTSIVFYALIATAATVFVCMCLACTNFDFTQWMLYVIVISVVFTVLTLIIMITMLAMNTYWKPVHLVLLIVGTLINVVVLIIELQAILGGKAVELSEDDYAMGAFLLYTSIIDIFVKFVQIFGILDDF